MTQESSSKPLRGRSGGGRSVSRRDLLKLGGAAAAGVGLAGFPALASARSTRPDQTTTIKFQGWDYQPTLVQQNLNNFEKLNPDIKVDYTSVVSAQYDPKIIAEFTGNTAPDAMYVYDTSMAGWVDAGYLQPLDGMPGLDKAYSMMYPANQKAMTYKGKRWGLPYYTDCTSMIYNADILQQVGISAPPKTWDELEQQAVKIKQAGILKYPIGASLALQTGGSLYTNAMAVGSGVELFDKNYNPVFQKNGKLEQLISWLHHAFNVTKVLDPAALTLVSAPYGQAFQTGNYYAFDASTSRYSIWTYNDPTKSPKIAGKMKLAVPPSLDGKPHGGILTTRMYGLSKTTKHKKQAYKLMYYLGGLDNTGKPYTASFWFQQEGLGFAYKELASQAAIKADIQKYTSSLAVYQQLSELASPLKVTGAPWYAQWVADGQRTLQQAIQGSISPKAAVTALAGDAQKLKKQYA